MIRAPHSRQCRMPSFRADISDQLTKFYFSSIPLLPPLMEKTYPPADVSFSFTVFFWNGAEAAAPPSPPDRPVSAVRRKYSLHGPCHKKKARTKRHLPGVSLHAGNRKTLFLNRHTCLFCQSSLCCCVLRKRSAYLPSLSVPWSFPCFFPEMPE